MPVHANKANFKSFDGQARFLRAVVAAHPEVSWNFKEILACFGSDMTNDALNHRFRALKTSSLIIKLGREAGFDMKDLQTDHLPKNQNQVDTDNIAKYFGASTEVGARSYMKVIKDDAKEMKALADKGGDLSTFEPSHTPAHKKRAAAAKSATPGSTSSAGKRGRKPAAAKVKVKVNDSDESDEPADFEELDQDPFPSKRVKLEKGSNSNDFTAAVEPVTPTKSRGGIVRSARASAEKAQETIKRAEAQLSEISSSSEGDTVYKKKKKQQMLSQEDSLPVRKRFNGVDLSSATFGQKTDFGDGSFFVVKDEESDGA